MPGTEVADDDTDDGDLFSSPGTALPSAIANRDGTNINFLQTLGNELILRAALRCGATAPMVAVQWKAERILVTVDVHGDENYDPEADMATAALDLEENGEGVVEEAEEGPEEDLLYDDAEEDFSDEYFNEEEFQALPSEDGISLPLIARTINEILAEDGEDSLAFSIAKLHDIEVSAPEWDNVLRSKQMFDTYKGFDVLVEHWEEPKRKKKKKVKSKAKKETVAASSEDDNVKVEMAPVIEPKLTITEGKLVGRDYEKAVTLLNIKGRVVKIKNDKIEGVRLPTAKREKGAK